MELTACCEIGLEMEDVTFLSNACEIETVHYKSLDAVLCVLIFLNFSDVSSIVALCAS